MKQVVLDFNMIALEQAVAQLRVERDTLQFKLDKLNERIEALESKLNEVKSK